MDTKVMTLLKSQVYIDGVPSVELKESGLGREGSRYGLEEFVEINDTLMGGI